MRGEPPILLRGTWYCAAACLDRVLADAFKQYRSKDTSAHLPAHRVPLGLLLLSRRQITAERLRCAIAAQQAAGSGRIGEWLQELGFVTEDQVTAALARQWACPVRRSLPSAAGLRHAPEIPAFILQSSAMIPVEYAKTTGTLYIAFGEGVDHSVLYAIEQMLDCRTEPCLVVPSLLRSRLQASFERRRQTEVVFDGLVDVGECVRIIRSYCDRIDVSEIRLVSCRSCLWIRLLNRTTGPLDLLFPATRETRQGVPVSETSHIPMPKVSHRSADGN
jgi:hypothetical protein